jgi:hypothetical protein
MNKSARGLCSGFGIALVAELPSMRTKAIAKLPLLDAQVTTWFCVADRQPFQRRLCRSLGLPPRCLDGVFETVP